MTWRIFMGRDFMVDVMGDGFQTLGDGSLQILRAGIVVAQFQKDGWQGVVQVV